MQSKLRQSVEICSTKSLFNVYTTPLLQLKEFTREIRILKQCYLILTCIFFWKQDALGFLTLTTLWAERFSKPMNFRNMSFLFFCPHLYNCLFLAFSDHFSKSNSSRLDILTVTCNRKDKVNHRWKWFITITQVSDRE